MKPTAKPLLKEQAYAQIKQDILHEVFEPGQFLSESQLIAHLGMSKTPIKSALDRLEVEGFLTVSPKQGIIVKELSIARANDIFGMRMALERYVLAEIGETLKGKTHPVLEQNLQMQRRCADSGDEIQYAKLDAQFHILLCELAGNAEICRVMEMYQDHLYRVVLRVLRRDRTRMHSSTADHEQLYEALCAGDISGSQELMQAHLLLGKQILV